jgi:uncharacterized protein YggU (UPF0235/DUF167 family)
MNKTEEPFYIKVRAITNQKNESFKKLAENSFEIRLREKPERNQANSRIIEILDGYYDHPNGGVSIINGHHSPKKLFRIGR